MQEIVRHGSCPTKPNLTTPEFVGELPCRTKSAFRVKCALPSGICYHQFISSILVSLFSPLEKNKRRKYSDVWKNSSGRFRYLYVSWGQKAERRREKWKEANRKQALFWRVMASRLPEYCVNFNNSPLSINERRVKRGWVDRNVEWTSTASDAWENIQDFPSQWLILSRVPSTDVQRHASTSVRTSKC